MAVDMKHLIAVAFLALLIADRATAQQPGLAQTTIQLPLVDRVVVSTSVAWGPSPPTDLKR
jgi:hypothetical protein